MGCYILPLHPARQKTSGELKRYQILLMIVIISNITVIIIIVVIVIVVIIIIMVARFYP